MNQIIYLEKCCLLILIVHIVVAYTIPFSRLPVNSSAVEKALQRNSVNVLLQKPRYLEGGDFTILNSILKDVKLPLALDIPKKTIRQTIAGFIKIRLEARVGDEGECEDLRVMNDGDVLISGRFIEGKVVMGNKTYEEYQISLKVVNIRFKCTIPLNVKLVAGGSGNSDGTLTFRTETSALTQKIRLFSEDFSIKPPELALVGSCSADGGDIKYTGANIFKVIGGLVDLTSIVLDEIRKDPDLVANDIENELCNIGKDLAKDILPILVSNDLIDESSNFYISDPFADGSVLSVEEAVRVEREFVRLFDWTNRENFIVSNLVSERGDGVDRRPVFYDIIDMIYPQQNSEYDSFLWLVSEELQLEMEKHDGNLLDIDLKGFITGETFLENSSADRKNNGNQLVTEFGLNIDGTSIEVAAKLSIESLNLTVFPGSLGDDSFVLSNIFSYGKQTLEMQRVNLGTAIVQSVLAFQVNISNSGEPGANENVFLDDNPFSFTFDEKIDVSVDWFGFVARLAALLGVNVDDFNKLMLGPTYEKPLECILSSLILPPRITGLTVDHDKVDVFVTGFVDAILVFLGDIVNVLLPVYQPVVPRALELLFDDALRNKDLLAAMHCTELENVTTLRSTPYDFSKGIFADVSSAVDANLVGEILESFSSNNGRLDIVQPKDALKVQIELSPNDIQNSFSIGVHNLYISGLHREVVDSVVVFDVIENSQYYPQDLHNAAVLASESSLIGLGGQIKFNKVANEQAPLAGIINQGDHLEENTLSFHIQASYLNLSLESHLTFSEMDVLGVELSEVLNIDCWIARLDSLGGIHGFQAFLSGVRIEAECNCTNSVLKGISSSLSSEEGWRGMEEFLLDLIRRYGDSVQNKFNPAEFNNTIAQAIDSCENRKVTNEETNLAVIEEDYAAIISFLGLLFLALLFPVLFGVILRKKCGVNLHEKEKLSKEEKNEKRNIHYVEPMYKNSSIPKLAKFLIPVCISANICLFVIGDTGVAVVINIVGHVLGVPLKMENFATLSVISTAVALWETGAYILALLLFIVSVGWPYMKLLLLMFSWFSSPSTMSLEKRGVLLEWLDILGRYSFAEFHFLVFVLLVFNIEGGSPNPSWLGDEEAFQLLIDIQPQVSLFTFSMAVVFSIILSNILLVLNNNLEDKARIRDRKEFLQRIEAVKKEAGVITHEIDEDKFYFGLGQWEFNVQSNAHNVEHGGKDYNYTFKITGAALSLLFVSISVVAVTLLYAATLESIHVEINGIAGFLVDWADRERKYDVSVFDLLFDIVKIYEGNTIIYFVASVFILTIVVFPALQTLVLFAMLFGQYTLSGARKLYQAHHIITVWCCVDVFVIAISLTVLELPTVAKGLVASIEECDILADIMKDFLLPLGLVEEIDVVASCIGIHSEITVGGYLCILVVLLLNFSNLFVGRLFHFFILDRETILHKPTTQEQTSFHEIRVIPFHKICANLGLIKIEGLNERRHRLKYDHKVFNLTRVESMLLNPDGAKCGTSKTLDEYFVPTRNSVLLKRKKLQARLSYFEYQKTKLQPATDV
eukprot:snap_masked-scaffold_18-processed-gene-2.34-mRNA-1 protein AED:1.00 eAED:1.00 QI:0/-1/0/0/-1/1/1/0/1543